MYAVKVRFYKVNKDLVPDYSNPLYKVYTGDKLSTCMSSLQNDRMYHDCAAYTPMQIDDVIDNTENDSIDVTNICNIKKLIKKLLTISNQSMAKVVKQNNSRFPLMPLTEANISNKLNRGTLRFDEVYLIALACGYKIKIEKDNK